MSEISEVKQPVNKRNAFTLSMMILVFALPPVAAYFMYYTGIMPDARMNKGTLIAPQQLPELSLHTIAESPFSISSFRGKWTMLMLATLPCDELCKKNIYLMRQVRTSLGKDSHNTERLLVISADTVPATMAEFLRDYPGMPAITGSQDAINKLKVLLTSVAGEIDNRVFIIDPEGRVMMHYEADLQPKDLLSDLKRLILVNSNDYSGSTN